MDKAQFPSFLILHNIRHVLGKNSTIDIVSVKTKKVYFFCLTRQVKNTAKIQKEINNFTNGPWPKNPIQNP